MLVWDPVGERHLPFGHLKTAASGISVCKPDTCLRLINIQVLASNICRVHAVRHQYRLISSFLTQLPVKIFDLLYLNGISLLQKSLKFRKRNLQACLTEVPGRVEFCAEYEGYTAKDVRDRMELVMASRGEGVVIKHPESAYVLNGRNKDWIKVCSDLTNTHD